MKPYPNIILVSPGAHYPAHMWTNTVELMRALEKNNQTVRTIIFSTTTEPIPPDLRDRVESVFIHTPLEKGTAGRWQERRFGALINATETAACLFKAFLKSKGKKKTVLHFVGGSYWVVILGALLFRRFHFVCSVYGPILSGGSSGLKGKIRPFMRKLVRRAFATDRLDLVFETEIIYDDLAAQYGKHIHLVHYAIDDSVKLVSRSEARRELNLPPDEKIILFFGTHRREKDYHTSLKGCLALPKPPLALFVGKVISSNDPQQVVADCHYPNSFIVNDFVADEKIKYYFAASDVVALPYEAAFSKGSGVLIECSRYIRPVIVSATPYFTSFLTRYKCGVSYIPSDSASFAKALGQVFADGEAFRDGLEQVRSEHSWKAIAGQYIKIYNGNDVELN
jgi:glycosyltransferase involved in cell wall biosynthesis